MPGRNAHLRCDSLCRSLVITCNHPDGEPLRLQVFDGLRRTHLHRIGHGHQSGRLTIKRDQHGRLTLLLEGFQLLLQRVIRDRALTEEAACAHQYRVTLHHRFQSSPG